MDYTAEMEEFAATRGKKLDDSDAKLYPIVEAALADFGKDWFDPIVAAASKTWLDIFETESPSGIPDSSLASFQKDFTAALEKTSMPSDPPDPAQVKRIVNWASTYAANSATFEATRSNGNAQKQWITRGDANVRAIHAAANGLIVKVTQKFKIGEYELRYPGEPVGSPEAWIECRCVMRSVGKRDTMTLTAATAPVLEDPVIEPDEALPVEEDDDEPDLDTTAEIPFHGVAAPIGVESGDKRMFAEGTVSFRKFPLILEYQDQSFPGHDGKVRIGRIDEMWIDEAGLIQYKGVFASVDAEPLVAKVIQLIVEGVVRGVSVDVDLYSAEMVNDVEVSTSARIAGLTAVSIGAFEEGSLMLGECDCPEEPVDKTPLDQIDSLAASAAPDGARTEAQRGLDWHADGKGGSGLESATIGRARKIAAGEDLTEDHISRMHSYFARHEVDKKGKGWSPDQDGYPSAGRVAWALWGGDAGKSFADAEFKRMESESSLTADGTFAPGTKDGPGWITNPVATSRIRRYWVHGKGAAKIKWGVPGDFNRCRVQLGKYVQNPDWLAGLCANMHKEALGVWPGQENGSRAALIASGAVAAPMVTLVASAVAVTTPQATWFSNPELDGPTPLTVTEEGRVYGHVATWGSCHIGLPGCQEVPFSLTNYAMFSVGLIETTDGDRAVGQLTMATGHAKDGATAAATVAHYDNTGSAVADIAVGEDTHGVWFSGALRETTTPIQRKQLRASGKVSGDWRRYQNHLEMVALLVVNVPGFQTPRTSMAASAGVQTSLVAANIVEVASEPTPVSVEMIDTLTAAVMARMAHMEKVRVTLASHRALLRSARIDRAKGRI